MKVMMINKFWITLIIYFLTKFLISRNMKIKWLTKKIMLLQIISKINNKPALTVNSKINLKKLENYKQWMFHFNSNNNKQWHNYSLQQDLLLTNLDYWLTFNKVEKLQINFSETSFLLIIFIYLLIEKNNLIIFLYLFYFYF